MANRKCVVFASITLTAAFLSAQTNTAEVQRHADAALKSGGAQWEQAARFFCSTEAQVNAMHILPSARQNDPPESRYAEPAKVFDNLYFVGTKEVTTWVIPTNDGYILIDAGYAGEEEKTMIAGMKKLGLDPAKIKAVLIAHGHADHFGGAFYLQEHFGAHVYMSAPDWDFIQPKPGAKGSGGPLPSRDRILEDGKPVTLGGTTVTPIFIPGHTPGAMGFVFNVTDNGQRHVAGLFGGTILNPQDKFPVSLFEQYLTSLQHFKEVTGRMKVDVELVNHPIMDGTFEKLAALKDRKPGQPHPFVVSETGFQNFATVMEECGKAQLVRHGGTAK
ncbi:MAG: MBL fold metallo-hydrolase [Bryobacteraceae bacterium]